MIKRLIYILLFLPLAVSSQYNFFYSHASCHLCYLYKNTPQYLGGYANYDISFNTDGTKMYVLGGVIRSTILQYSLSTAWNTRSATYSTAFGTQDEEIYPHGMFIKPDGTKLYVIGSDMDEVYQYSLTTAWNIGTATYENKSYDISGQEIIPTALYFNSDGSKFFIVGQDSKTVYAYTMVTNWDVSTANYGSESYSISTEETYPHSLFFSSDGLYMYIQGIDNNTIYRYLLSTAWTLPDPWNGETVELIDSYKIVEDEAHGIYIKSDWTKVYTVGIGNVCVYYFNESDFTPPVDLKEGLISCYEFDETSGTTATDAHGSNDGTVTGATINQTGKIDKAYSFDGNDKVTFGTFNAGTSAMSAFCWVKTSLTSAQMIFTKYDYGSGDRSWNMNMTAAGKLQVYISDNGTAAKKIYYTDDSINDNDWHLVGFTFDSGTLKLWIDGVDAAVTKTTDDAATSIHQSSKMVGVGFQINNGSYVVSYQGLIDQPGLWSKALSTNEISALYNSGNGKAYSTW